jgi:hypothetical protein
VPPATCSRGLILAKLGLVFPTTAVRALSKHFWQIIASKPSLPSIIAGPNCTAVQDAVTTRCQLVAPQYPPLGLYWSALPLT